MNSLLGEMTVTNALNTHKHQECVASHSFNVAACLLPHNFQGKATIIHNCLPLPFFFFFWFCSNELMKSNFNDALPLLATRGSVGMRRKQLRQQKWLHQLLLGGFGSSCLKKPMSQR